MGGFAAALQQIGERVREQHLLDLSERKSRQDAAIKMYEALSNNESVDPETRQEFLKRLMEIQQTPVAKYDAKKFNPLEIIEGYHQREFQKAQAPRAETPPTTHQLPPMGVPGEPEVPMTATLPGATPPPYQPRPLLDPMRKAEQELAVLRQSLGMRGEAERATRRGELQDRTAMLQSLPGWPELSRDEQLQFIAQQSLPRGAVKEQNLVPRVIQTTQGPKLVNEDRGRGIFLDAISRQPVDPSTITALEASKPDSAGTTDIRNYQFQKSQGYKGTFEQYQREQANLRTPQGPSGSFTPILDENGIIVSFYNPATGASRPAPPGARRGALPAAVKLRRETFSGIKEDLDTLERLGERNPGAIGAIAGRLSALKRQTIGAGEEVNDLFRISDNITDKLMRARSGAQINEREYERLRSLVPDPRGPLEKFRSDLKSFRREVERDLAQSITTTAPSGKPDPAGEADLRQRLESAQPGDVIDTPQGKVRKLPNGKFQKVQ